MSRRRAPELLMKSVAKCIRNDELGALNATVSISDRFLYDFREIFVDCMTHWFLHATSLDLRSLLEIWLSAMPAPRIRRRIRNPFRFCSFRGVTAPKLMSLRLAPHYSSICVLIMFFIMPLES